MKTVKVTTQILGTITVNIQSTIWGWAASEENYDGDEDRIRINHSFKSEQEAIDGLIEKMEEHELSQQHDDRPSHLDDFLSGEGIDNDN